MAFCKQCGAEIAEENAFCPKCGTKQVQRYTQTFQRGKMSEAEFIDQINRWFAQYPHIANVKGKFLTRSRLGLLVNKYVLDAFSIEYELLSGTNQYQYGVINLSSFSLVKTSTEVLLNRWLNSNPGAQVLDHHGGVHQRGTPASLILGGIGAANKSQLYVFFKFKRATGTAAVDPK